MGVEVSDLIGNYNHKIIRAVVSMKKLNKTVITSVQYNICLY